MMPDAPGALYAFDPDEDLDEDDEEEPDEEIEDDEEDDDDEEDEDEDEDDSETWQVEREGPRALKPAAGLTSRGERA
jgi:hypothetical protein